MVDQGVIFGHIISSKGLEVDKAKTNVSESLPCHTYVLKVHSLLGHSGFYQRFIKEFSKIACPMCELLQKDIEFKLSEACKRSFDQLKEYLITTQVFQPSDWNFPLEIVW